MTIQGERRFEAGHYRVKEKAGYSPPGRYLLAAFGLASRKGGTSMKQASREQRSSECSRRAGTSGVHFDVEGPWKRGRGVALHGHFVVNVD